MSNTSKIAWDDTVLPFQLDQSDIRGRVARLDGVLDHVLAQHDYPPLIEALVAEMSLLTALIGQTIALRWKLSLQVRGNGPVRLIATDYYGPTDDGQPARIRAYASYDKDAIDLNGDGYDQIGNGYFAILIDQGKGTQALSGHHTDCGWLAVNLCRGVFCSIRAITHAICAHFRPLHSCG
jgi:molecular chaperone Hsp33